MIIHRLGHRFQDGIGKIKVAHLGLLDFNHKLALVDNGRGQMSELKVERPEGADLAANVNSATGEPDLGRLHRNSAGFGQFFGKQ